MRAHLRMRTACAETLRPRTGRSHQIRVHLQYLGHPIANDVQYGGTYPGPVPTRVHMPGGDAGGRLHQPDARAPCSAAAAASAAAAVAAKAAAADGASDRNGARRVGTTQLGPLAGCGDAAVAPSAAEDSALGGGTGGCNGGGSARRVAASGVGLEEPGTGATACSRDAQAGIAATRPAAAAGADLGARLLCPEGLRDPLCVHCPSLPPRDWPVNLHPLWLHALRYGCETAGWAFECDPPDWAQPGFVPQAG